MKKTRKPKYYVAQTGANINSGFMNNISDPITAQFLKETNPAQNPWTMFDNGTDAPRSSSNTSVATIPQQPINTSMGIPAPTKGSNPGINYTPPAQQKTSINPYIDKFNEVAQGITSVADTLTNNKLNKEEQQQLLKSNQRFQQAPQGPLNTNPAYTKYGGVGARKYQVGGQTQEDGLDYSNPDYNDYSGDLLEQLKAGGWIKSRKAQTGGGFTQQNIAASHSSGINDAYLADDINSILANNKRTNAQGVYTPDQKNLITSAYIYKATNPGRTPEDIITGFYGRPTTTGNAVDSLRSRLKNINYSPVANYNSTPNISVNSVPQRQVGGASNTQVPVQPSPQYPDRATLKKKYASNPYLNDDQGRYNWGNKLDTEFQSNEGGNVRNAVYAAARQNKIDPALLYSSAMEEGMTGRLNKKNAGDVSGDYPDSLAATHPIDGYLNYGLDQFGDQAKALEQKGYLPKGFSSRVATYKTHNEKGEALNAPAFENDADALLAKSAMMKQSQDQLSSYAKKSGVNLTPEQQNFFLLANYNGGEGNMQKMIQSYQDKGYLKDNKFLDPSFKPASYGSIYNNVQARLQSASQLKNEGYFNDYNTQGSQASNAVPAGKTMQVGGFGGGPHDDLITNDFMAKAGGWIKGAINPAHKGYCTPMTKSTCTPRRKALARRFKSGDLSHHQAGGDLYNDVPQYEIDNNLIMQAGGVPQVQGLDQSQAASANVEAEKGEVFTTQNGNMAQVDPNGATHEQGGEMLPQVSRVLENTSNLRNDKVSKYLKLNPEQIKALTGLDTTSSMSHAEALIKGQENLEKQKNNIISKIQLATKGRNGIGLDMYGENSTKLNIDHFRAMPTKQELFNRLFDHQEMTKNALGISNDGGMETARYGGRYIMQAGGVTAYPGNTSGQTTPAGNSDAFQGDLNEYLGKLKANGFKFDNIHSNADLQKALYANELKNNPNAIKGMWQEGIQNYGLDKAIKAGFVYDQDDPSKGIKKGQFKPGILDKPENLQKLADLYPDNLLGRRILQLSANKGPKVWNDNDLPPIPNNPQAPINNPDPSIKNNVNLRQNPKSTFDEPLNWYDTASSTNAYLAAQRRLPENFNHVDVHQLNLKLLDPTVTLRANQSDFNAAVQATQQADPNNTGAQMANIANLTARKYALNNQVMGNYDQQNAGIKNQEITYNTQAKDKQSVIDAQAREDFSNKVLTSKAKQQEQKLTALDGLYKTIAENSALNRNGNLIEKMSRAFDQYGNYNGYAPSFQPNPQLGISSNPSTNATPSGKAQPAGGIQSLTPGKNYYNRKTGKTLRFDGVNLTEVK